MFAIRKNKTDDKNGATSENISEICVTRGTLRCLAALSIFAVGPNVSYASEAEDQARSFAKIYAATCMLNINDLNALRKKLEPMPKLPPEKAAMFLSGQPGDAWPVPDKHGTFVLALPHEVKMCFVFAQRASVTVATDWFDKALGTAPPPLISKLMKNETIDSKLNGPTQVISYGWSVPDAKRTMLFTLSTSISDTAQIQVLGSAALTAE